MASAASGSKTIGSSGWYSVAEYDYDTTNAALAAGVTDHETAAREEALKKGEKVLRIMTDEKLCVESSDSSAAGSRSGFKELSEAVVDRFLELRQTADEELVRMEILHDLQEIISREIGRKDKHARAHVFGSTATGLGARGTDVDLCFVGRKKSTAETAE